MTDEEIEQAEKDAEQDAKELLLLLLLSKRVIFDAGKGKFYVDGKTVSITTVRNYLQRIEKRLGRRSLDLLNKLEAGTISLDEWQTQFHRQITSAHVLAAALALGGISAAVRNADVQARIDSELKYASGFKSDLKKDGVSGRSAPRTTSYFMATAITFGIVQQIVRQIVGRQTECQRVRRASESCEGCIAYSYRWMPIAEMPAIGSLQCGGRCRCYLEYR